MSKNIFSTFQLTHHEERHSLYVFNVENIVCFGYTFPQNVFALIDTKQTVAIITEISAYPHPSPQNQGNNALVGFLLDGFPVYGPFENGERVVNSLLDDYHGHEHVTADYPEGIYHYHITDADPYINGSGYYGTAGTVTR